MGIENLDNQFHLNFKLKLAGDYAAEGKFLHALQIYEKLIRDTEAAGEPPVKDAWYGIADIYEKLGNVDAAVTILTEILDSDPENKEVRLFLGQFLLRNARWDDAIDVLSYIIPEEELMVSFFLGYAHFMLKDFEIAGINFKSFIQTSGQSELFYEANMYLAKIEIQLHRFDKALKFAKRADVLYSNYWELHYIYAQIYYNLDMHAHAVVPVEKAIKLNPNDSNLYELAGRIFFKLGDFFKAEKHFLQLIEKSEDISSEAYTKLAEACLKGNKKKDALLYFDIALKLDPENKNASEWKKYLTGTLNNNLVTDV